MSLWIVLPWSSSKSFSWIYFHFSWVMEVFLGVELLGHMLIPHLCYILRNHLLCRVAVPFSIASSSVWRFQFLCILIICYYILIMAIQQVWSYISLWLWFAFPWLLMTLCIFLCAYWPFVYPLWRNVYSDLLPNFN